MAFEKGAYPREFTGDAGLDRIQAELVRLRALITRCPFLEGGPDPLEILVGVTPTTIAHRLGKRARGFIVMDASTPTAVGRSAVQPSDETRSINLEATVAATCKLWFW